MPDTLRRLIVDLVYLVIGMLAWLSLSDHEAQGATKPELRAHRHAVETMYESCVASCRDGCGRAPR